MNLAVTQPAASTALVSLSTVKTLLGVTGSDQDALLGIYLDGVSSTISLGLGRDDTLGRQGYSEELAPTTGSVVWLTSRPVDSSTVTVTFDGQAVEDWSLLATGDLFRQGGWAVGWGTSQFLELAYFGGYLLPGDVTTWTASAPYALGAWVRPATGTSRWRFEATDAGTAGGSAPVWPTTLGDTVIDGGVVWTARDARELPTAVSILAAQAVKELYERSDRAGDLASWTGPEGVGESYSTSLAAKGIGTLSPQVLDGVRRLRYRV